jgi:hypothetical protein
LLARRKESNGCFRASFLNSTKLDLNPFATSDFSHGTRGKFFKPDAAIRLPVYLDPEFAFSRAMADEPIRRPIIDALSPELEWYSPSLRPRCEALQAALTGDGATMQRKLEDSERLVRGSIDRAMVVSEGMLREAVWGKLGAREV